MIPFPIKELRASLLLDKFQEEEIRRLDEKASLMRRELFDDRAKWMDDFWRRKNAEMLELAEGLINDPR